MLLAPWLWVQKATQDARSLDGKTKDRDRLGRELAAANQKLAVAIATAAEQAEAIAQSKVQHQQVGSWRFLDLLDVADTCVIMFVTSKQTCQRDGQRCHAVCSRSRG